MPKLDRPFGTTLSVSNGILTCRLCGKSAAMKLLCVEKGYHIYQCPQCDFITTDPVPTADELVAFYSQHFLRGDAGNVDYWDAPRKPVFAQAEMILQQSGITKASRILDIGAAYGAFLHHLQHDDYTQLTAVDLSAPAVEYLKSKLHINAHCGDITTVTLPAASFDAITLLDTLEHLPNFRAILQEVARLLAPGGVVMIRVPNMKFHLCKLRILDWLPWESPYGIFTPPGHLNHFTPRALQALLWEAGLQPAGQLNGVADHIGSRTRIFALTCITLAANTLRALTGGRVVLGNSMILLGRK